MCFSAAVSYSAAAVLVPTGIYALYQARRLQQPYWLLALVPIFFGIQQGFEGRVWQALDAGSTSTVIAFALGFHFFSHFLWLWWFPLCSYVLEPVAVRKRVFLGFVLFGTFAGSLVYSTMLLHPDWMKVVVNHHSILYDYSVPYRVPFSIPLPASVLYSGIVLVPLLFSSYRQLRIFGGLVGLSMVLAMAVYDYAFISVWCFFAAVLSLYLVLLIRRLVAETEAHLKVRA
jgi:hypothetical protein